LIGLALVMAYPYLPGAGTEALQGLSVFAGLLFSLGAAGAVSNVIAGYLNTFGRVFRAGDFIQVGETRGEVIQVRLMTTRVRTVTNEQVTIPNSSFLTTSVVNYTALAASHGLILHTEVGIGYEVPWRQVHAMLEEAARRTPDVLESPPPFVVQRSLGDFAVVYRLNIYVRQAQGMVLVYSRLHQHILDVFNEHGVQIMTPAYEGDPAEPKTVPPEKWFTPPAKGPRVAVDS
jgi:small-conductance mechanosensitive channel